MKRWTKSLAHAMLGDYSIYRIYARSNKSALSVIDRSSLGLTFSAVSAALLDASIDPLIREQNGYAGAGSYAYAGFQGERIVGVCFYWNPERYRTRNFWPLAEGEAKLVQIVVVPDVRGHGVATSLISFSSNEMVRQGFHRHYARIWHSNKPSLIAFENAHWTRVATVVEINPLRRGRPLRFTLPAARNLLCE